MITENIPYRLDKPKQGAKFSIIIKRCPTCGKEGILHRDKNKLIIKHDKKDIERCTFTMNKNFYDDLKEIYNYVRR